MTLFILKTSHLNPGADECEFAPPVGLHDGCEFGVVKAPGATAFGNFGFDGVEVFVVGGDVFFGARFAMGWFAGGGGGGGGRGRRRGSGRQRGGGGGG